VVGDGVEMPAVRASAGSNVEILGHQSNEVLRDLMQRSKAVHLRRRGRFRHHPGRGAGLRDAVIACGVGGVLDSVVGEGSSKTGTFFQIPSPPSIAAAVRSFEREPESYSPVSCHANAKRFGGDQFRKRFVDYVAHKCQ
jgi:hypothetical protein